MTEEQAEGDNPKQAEYERRRSVWRYVHNLPGPQLPPCEADALWLDGERSLTDVSGSRDE